MSDNNLRQQIEKAQAQAEAIKTGNRNQQANIVLKPAATSKFGLDYETKFRESKPLNEGVDFTNGTN